MISKLSSLFRSAFLILAIAVTPVSAFAAEVVNINRADAATMIENWKGIGEKKARAIVSYRKKNGNFSSLEDLKNVKGIGEGLVKNNRRYMSVSKGVFKPTGKTNTKDSKTSKSSTKNSTSKDSKKTKTTKKEKSKASKTSKSDSKKSSTTKKKSSKCKPNSKDKNCTTKTKKKKSSKKSKKKKASTT